MTKYYIGADVHNNSTELAIEKRNKIVARYSVPTTIPAISNVLDSLQGKKYLAIEEGPMAGWLYRNLNKKVDKFIASDPRRNKLISSDGDSDDRIDATKLACLLRGNYLRSVYHSDDDQRSELKHWVALYHDRVRDAVRHINKIRARCRMYGVRIPRLVLRDPAHRLKWLSELKQPALTKQLKMLWIGYDATAKQARIAEQQLIQLSKTYPIICSWKELPGIGLIRATTLFAFIDTPWRFSVRSPKRQTEKQTMEILRRGPAENNEWNRQKRQAKTSKITTALGGQPNIEKCGIRCCPQRNKSKR